MTEHRNRIVVDGVDFGAVFAFPRVLRSITGALQPARLVVALLMVVSLIAVGGAWDGLAGPTVPAHGLVADAPTAEAVAESQADMRAALERFGATVASPVDGALDPAAVVAAIDAAYGAARGEGTDGADAAPDDAEYLSTRARLEGLLPMGAFAALSDVVAHGLHQTVRGVIYLRPQLVGQATRDVVVRLPASLWRNERGFAIVFGLVALVVFSIGGGALCRMAACDVARREHIRVRDACDFALGNWVKLVLTPLVPLIMAGVVAAVMILMGIVLLPWLDVLGGLLYGIAILLGLVIAFLLLGYLIGFPLLLPAVASENCDAADAQQRAYAYVLNRPLHLIGYAITGVVGLALGYFVVALISATVLNFTAALAGVIAGGSALVGAGGASVFDLGGPAVGDIHATWHDAWAGSCIAFWKRVVVDLAAAWVVAYFFSCSTTIYLLMRKACDGQDIEEIWRPGYTPGMFVPIPTTDDEKEGADDDSETPTDTPAQEKTADE